jgi:hypothetical protein
MTIPSWEMAYSSYKYSLKSVGQVGVAHHDGVVTVRAG